MYLVLRRGALEDLSHAGALAGAAAVACVRAFAEDPAYAEALAAWRERPGKVCLRARTEPQWRGVLEEPHTLAGEADGAGVVALPPRRRSERGPLLERLQAMSSELAPPAAGAEVGGREAGVMTYLLNPGAPMSSGKTIAQVAHAAVMAADEPGLAGWVAAGCPGRVLTPSRDAFARAASGPLAARVEDAGLTEVPPGTVTVVALAPAE
ncbi:MAG: aminoacyl-tRNA hydrolase [Solirubrobacteraceae bacterium]